MCLESDAVAESVSDKVYVSLPSAPEPFRTTLLHVSFWLMV